MTITAVSVVIALVVGGVEALGLLAGRLHPRGLFWEGVRSLNERFGLLGFGVIALFLLSWVVSIGVYRWRRFDFW
jgi:high-affinity nickel-transport protein